MKTKIIFYNTGFKIPDEKSFESMRIERSRIREESIYTFPCSSSGIDIATYGTDFQETYDLAEETDGKLTNAKLKELAEKNGIDIPQSPFGTLYSLLVIFCDDEPLIFYPQMKNGKEITIEIFLYGLKKGEIRSLASESTSELLRKALTLWINF